MVSIKFDKKQNSRQIAALILNTFPNKQLKINIVSLWGNSVDVVKNMLVMRVKT